MPVDDIPVHDKVRHDRPPTLCHQSVITYRNPKCRQIGRRVDGTWEPLPECVGCIADKDREYIAESRAKIDKENTSRPATFPLGEVESERAALVPCLFDDYQQIFDDPNAKPWELREVIKGMAEELIRCKLRSNCAGCRRRWSLSA